MQNLSFFNLNTLYKNRSLLLFVNDFAFSSIFEYYHTGLLVVARARPKFEQFRIVLLSHIYVRLNPLDITLTPLIKQLISVYGVPPGWNTIISLLPDGGLIGYQNFLSLQFKLTDDLVAEITKCLNDKTLARAFSEYKLELTRDNILFDSIGVNLVSHSVSYMNFIVLNGSNFTIYFDAGNIKITQSLMACLLFGLQCANSHLDDFRIICNSKYTSILTNAEYSIAITTILHHLFGSQVGFGRQLVQGSATGTSHGYVHIQDRIASSSHSASPSPRGRASVSDMSGRRSFSFKSMRSEDLSKLSEAEKVSLLSLIFKLRLVK